MCFLPFAFFPPTLSFKTKMPTHPNLLSVKNSLLIVVDLQTKLSAAMPEADAKQVTANVGSLVEATGLLSIPVLLTEQYPKGLGSTDTTITDLLSEDTLIFDKTGFSSCAANGFTDTLANTDRKQIILVGQEAHVCVLQTALELLHLGYQVHVVEDAICSRKAEHKFYALQRMQQQGATITNYESVLFEWVRDSTHPEFKKISGLLR
jgi:nicotinamidase-related amidase